MNTAITAESNDNDIKTAIGKRIAHIICVSRMCYVGATDEDYLEIGNCAVEVADLFGILSKKKGFVNDIVFDDKDNYK